MMSGGLAALLAVSGSSGNLPWNPAEGPFQWRVGEPFDMGMCQNGVGGPQNSGFPFGFRLTPAKRFPEHVHTHIRSWWWGWKNWGWRLFFALEYYKPKGQPDPRDLRMRGPLTFADGLPPLGWLRRCRGNIDGVQKIWGTLTKWPRGKIWAHQFHMSVAHTNRSHAI